MGPDLGTRYAELGFLSAEADGLRLSAKGLEKDALAAATAEVRLAFEDLQMRQHQAIPAAEWAALGLWHRALEAAQAAIMLTDRGMQTSAAGACRTAYECLFIACAMWADDSVRDRFWTEGKVARSKTSKGYTKAFERHELEESSWEAIADHANSPEGKGLSVFEAAQIAGLTKAYESAYRGFSALGAHATDQSLAQFAMTSDGERNNVLKFGPSFTWATMLLRGVIECLKIGRERCRSNFGQIETSPP